MGPRSHVPRLTCLTRHTAPVMQSVQNHGGTEQDDSNGFSDVTPVLFRNGAGAREREREGGGSFYVL